MENLYELAAKLWIMIKERKMNPNLAEEREIQEKSKANYTQLLERGLISNKTFKERVPTMPVKLIRK